MKTTPGMTVDEEILQCLDLDSPKSFFLFAGAGSGKTRSLVNALSQFRKEKSGELRYRNQKVAVITYTNAACDEINRRLEFDDTFVVSTIHSFSWTLIKAHQNDIREWLRHNLQVEITELKDAQLRGRAGTKAAEDRPRLISAKERRLNNLDEIRQFSYNPNGDNSGRDSLNHSEVIGIAADFITNKPLLKRILISRYPIVLIDESQDTKKELIEAFQALQASFSNSFSLGLFGDMMQRIYGDGKEDLGRNIPDDWATPKKVINYRCPRRIVKLINRIRRDVDGQEQFADKPSEGHVRLFVVDTKQPFDKAGFERAICRYMASISEDESWLQSAGGSKILTLEHHMAASRGGFSDFFEPLYRVDKYRTGLIDGSLPGVALFSDKVIPLVASMHSGDSFNVARLMRKHSPLLKKEKLEGSGDPRKVILRAKQAVDTLLGLWNSGADPTLMMILTEVCRTGLFEVPDILETVASRSEKAFESVTEEEIDGRVSAWEAALASRYSQFKEYVHYISEGSRFGTHQGIKGLQFPRVTVILDDEEARGFMFSYDKLFGTKEFTAADKKNVAEGKETSIDRTRRLFYVTCSRSESSLAVLAYTKNPDRVKEHVSAQEWFSEDEIIICKDPPKFIEENSPQ